jgi:hypothetical protein
MNQSLENLATWIGTVDSWELFVDKVAPLLAIPDPLNGPLTLGEHRAVLQTICAHRDTLSPVVQRLWQKGVAPRRLWSPLLAIMGIVSRSK